MAQSTQRLNTGYLTESVHTECQAISHRLTIDFRAFIGILSPTILCVREPRGPFLMNGCRVPHTGVRSA
jgi:hypothetical protein